MTLIAIDYFCRQKRLVSKEGLGRNSEFRKFARRDNHCARPRWQQKHWGRRIRFQMRTWANKVTEMSAYGYCTCGFFRDSELVLCVLVIEILLPVCVWLRIRKKRCVLIDVVHNAKRLQDFSCEWAAPAALCVRINFCLHVAGWWLMCVVKWKCELVCSFLFIKYINVCVLRTKFGILFCVCFWQKTTHEVSRFILHYMYHKVQLPQVNSSDTQMYWHILHMWKETFVINGYLFKYFKYAKG